MYLKKVRNRIFILTIIISNIFISYGCTKNKVNIRPIEIEVFDAKTNLPMKNINVYYQVKSYIYLDKFFHIIPRFETRQIEKSKIIKQYNTDSFGKIYIKNNNIELENDEKIYSEEIVINIDIDENKIKEIQLGDSIKEINKRKKINNFFHYFNTWEQAITECFYNPVAENKGFLIFGTIEAINSADHGGSVREKFDILWNSKSLTLNKENIIVKLKRYK